ncbi:MAG: MurR/RpiR family transcriptional regulator [Ruminococcaceae bacterium]|nr:MurR/RpiR family transcriptional regulator [Oscillospiraceae bacterium]
MNCDVLKKIENGMGSFSKGQKLIANYILDHYDKAAYLTASKLGAYVGVSESTVVRFAIELGFEGYPEFQHALQEIMRNRLTSFQRIEVTNSLIGDENILERVLISDAEKIRRTLEEVDQASFERAIERITSAKRIYIIGVRSSSSLASFLNFNFQMIFDNVKFIQTTSGSEMFEQIMQIGEGDVMIAISFPRYSKRIINAVEYARSRKANVVALTDSKVAPIAAHADELLIAQSDMISFVDSLVAPLSIINAIVMAVSRKKQKEVTERLRILEEVWDRYEVYDKKRD